MGGTARRPPAVGGRRPTMRDVAAAAGVSLKTVSRVVNAEPGVSPELVQRVGRAVEALDFRPNLGASNLRRADGKTSTVALLLENVANPYSSVLHRAVEDVAMSRGVVVFSASLDEDPARERELVRIFSARRADGLILAPAGTDQSYLAKEVAGGMPIVCVDREPRGIALDSVTTTNTTGAAEAVRHLVRHGHRRIAFLGDARRIVTAQERFQGYLDALSGMRLPHLPGLVVHDVGDSALADGAASTLLTRPEPPTAIFAAQNLVTIGVIRALRRLGLERSVALVGFDDFPLADLTSPGITVVAQDPIGIGRTAASLLFSRLAGDTSPPGAHVVPTTLIRRGSGEIAPALP